jgi:hypothetical protein
VSTPLGGVSGGGEAGWPARLPAARPPHSAPPLRSSAASDDSAS